MAISTLKGSTVEAQLWAEVHEVESQALSQLRNIASLPWVAHLAVMPDVHFGKGATVGSVIAMRGAVSPAAVGVDIGCGMGAVKTNLVASDLGDLKALRLEIESLIPVGFSSHDTENTINSIPDSKDKMALKKDIGDLLMEFKHLDKKVQDLDGKAITQLGTLGGGNHFIELCLDTGKCDCDEGLVDAKFGSEECIECLGKGTREPSVWMMLHSGSRNIGKTLAEIHMAKAKKLDHNVGLPDHDLAVFLAGTDEMKAYRKDLYWAQRYAMLNRRLMFELYKKAMRKFYPQSQFEAPVLCHHNYVSEEIHFGEELMVTRKGAISADKGQMGVIPGSMGTRSYVVRGLGHEPALRSASHGAGRRMSRGEAKRSFTVEDVEKQTQGVECRKDEGVIDEIPSAYKNIEKVMEQQKDLVEVVAELRQVLCVKG